MAIPKIRSVMTPFPQSIDCRQSVDRAKAMMSDLGVRHLPVKHGGDLAGVITSRDIERAQLMRFGLGSSGELLVQDVTVPEAAYVVDHGAPLDEALEEMARRGIGSTLVVHEGKLIGIFTTVDACRTFCDHLRSEARVKWTSRAGASCEPKEEVESCE